VPVSPWVSVAELPEDRPLLGPDPDASDAEWARAARLATDVLYALSGRRWAGAVQRTVEIVAVNGVRWPALVGSVDWWWDGSWGACLERGEVINHAGCGPPVRVRLPHAPVASVDAVTVGDTLRDPSSYRLADGRWLEDRTGRGWPTCDPGVLVLYTAGIDPPDTARWAARQLALELGYSRAGDGRCRLPSHRPSINRQGISQSFTPAADLIAKGLTGLPEIDLWLGSVNPGGRRHRPSVWSPEMPRTYQQETP
jgi:hypothetical protein